MAHEEQRPNVEDMHLSFNETYGALQGAAELLEPYAASFTGGTDAEVVDVLEVLGAARNMTIAGVRTAALYAHFHHGMSARKIASIAELSNRTVSLWIAQASNPRAGTTENR